MKGNYVIIFDNNNFTSINDFVMWAFKNKNIILECNFDIKSEIQGIDVKKIENIISFLKYYLKVKKSCDNRMNEYNDTLRQLSDNKELKNALEEFVRMSSDGKGLRAALAALGYHSINGFDDKYLDLSLALEIFQTSILIHDDIIDKATLRRGKDTIPISYVNKNADVDVSGFIEKRSDYANGMALCLGDLGFYLAEEVLVKGYENESTLPAVLSYYHNMAIKTCLGEMIDVELPFLEEFYSSTSDLEEKVLEIYKLKTAWYSVIGPFCLGMTLAGSNREQIKVMEDILLNVGVAFQIKDDLLGIYGDDKYIGKSTNSDIEEYKQTILYSYTMNTSYKDDLLKYYGKKDLNKLQIDIVKEIFEKSGAKKYAVCLMEKLFNSSLNDIKNIAFIDDEIKDILAGFIVYLENRMK